MAFFRLLHTQKRKLKTKTKYLMHCNPFMAFSLRFSPSSEENMSVLLWLGEKNKRRVRKKDFFECVSHTHVWITWALVGNGGGGEMSWRRWEWGVGMLWLFASEVFRQTTETLLIYYLDYRWKQLTGSKCEGQNHMNTETMDLMSKTLRQERKERKGINQTLQQLHVSSKNAFLHL